MLSPASKEQGLATEPIEELLKHVARRLPEWERDGDHEQALVTIATLIGALLLDRAFGDAELSAALRAVVGKHLSLIGA